MGISYLIHCANVVDCYPNAVQVKDVSTRALVDSWSLLFVLENRVVRSWLPLEKPR